MADIFAAEQGKRLFGFIAAGGSAGALLGPALTVWLAGRSGPVNLLIVAAVLLEAAVLCAHRLESAAPRKSDDAPAREPAAQAPIGGNPFAGFALLLRSPYLAGIALWVLLLSLVRHRALFRSRRTSSPRPPTTRRCGRASSRRSISQRAC